MATSISRQRFERDHDGHGRELLGPQRQLADLADGARAQEHAARNHARDQAAAGQRQACELGRDIGLGVSFDTGRARPSRGAGIEPKLACPATKERGDAAARAGRAQLAAVAPQPRVQTAQRGRPDQVDARAAAAQVERGAAAPSDLQLELGGGRARRITELSSAALRGS